jgi:hypothetical protein
MIVLGLYYSDACYDYPDAIQQKGVRREKEPSSPPHNMDGFLPNFSRRLFSFPNRQRNKTKQISLYTNNKLGRF